VQMRRVGSMAAAIGVLLVLPLLLMGCAEQPGNDGEADWAAIRQAYPELGERMPEHAVVKRVIDGDTFETAAGDKVRLIGADTPETFGKAEPYGKEASDYSKRELTGKGVWLFRDVSKTDRYGRLLRFAFLEGESLMFNERLIREGYANVMTVAPDVTMADRFVEAERAARRDGTGLWAATQEGSDAHPNGDPGAACASPTIKGNINSRGDKIYHIPGSKSYEQTKPEAWFCTEEEARQAGYRAPKS
jgi:micrococcal nuclease